MLFVEGYRPPSLQRDYFDEYGDQLRADHPNWSAEKVRSAASRYVSPPEIAPHSAGAAVDLTLADADGRELDMGTCMNATPEESAGACYTQADNISDEARSYRDTIETSWVRRLPLLAWSTTPQNGGTGHTEIAIGL